MKKRLLFIIPYFNSVGGLEEVIKNRLEFLSNHFEILVFETNTSFKNNHLHNYKVVSINYKNKSFLSIFNFIFQNFKVNRSFKPDLVTVLDNGWKGLLLPYLFFNSKIIYERHCELDLSLNYFKNISWIANFYKILALKFDKIIFLSEFMSMNWRHPNKIVMPNGVYINNNQIKTANTNRIIWVGRESNEKGIDILDDLWLNFNEREDCLLDVFLPNPTNYNFKNNKNLNVFIGITEKKQIYEKGGILINTSRNEGLPITFLEAMSYGIPIITFDLNKSINNIIKEHDIGILIDKFDTDIFKKEILKLQANLELYLQMSKNGLELVKTFDIDKIHSKWLNLYKETN